MKKSILTIAAALWLGMQTISASVQTDIETANKAGKVVFLVVTEQGSSENEAAKNLARESQKLFPKSEVLELNRTEKANKDLVAKYRVAGIVPPLVLVIASNGVVSGGAYYKETTAEKLVAMIPTLGKAGVLKAVNEGKAVFVVVSKKAMKKKEVLNTCETACAEMKDNAKIIEIDFDNPAEKKFLDELKISEIGNEPGTYVINAKGQIAGSFTGLTDTKTLVATATATKKSGSGCCPPGSNKSCGPKK